MANAPFRQKINGLKKVRDKSIAHNEHAVDFDDLQTFWADYLDLIRLVKLFISLFGCTILNNSYNQFEDFEKNSIHFSIIIGLNWLVEEIETEIGKEKFRNWWVS